MAETICASDAPPSAPSLATMAVATSAAVLAGVMLGRKGLPGIAAGVAALAGAKWLSCMRRDESVTARTDLSPEVYPPQPACPDWVDHDAVDFGHIVPDSAEATEMLKEKVLPLLDDDGEPVVEVTVHPVYPEEPAYDFPLGPIIWEPGRFAQSRSDSTSETVWFGLQDAAPAIHIHEAHVPALSAPATPEFAAKHAEANAVLMPPQPSEQVPVEAAHAPQFVSVAPAVFPAGEGSGPIAPPAQLPAPISKHPFLSAPGNSPNELPPGASIANLGVPSSPGDFRSSFTPSASAGSPSIITPKPAAKSFLPQPRHPGELPKGMSSKNPGQDLPSSGDSPSDDARAPVLDLPPARGMWLAGLAPPPHRQLEPFAPVAIQPRARRWPLLVLLTLVLAIGFIVVLDQWQEGGLLRKMKSLSWFQTPVDAEHAATVPTAHEEALAPSPTKPGSWLNVAPEPEK